MVTTISSAFGLMVSVAGVSLVTMYLPSVETAFLTPLPNVTSSLYVPASVAVPLALMPVNVAASSLEV